MIRNMNQDQIDAQRVSYLLTFPSDLDEKNVQTWLRAINTSMKTGGGLLSAVDTLVFETWATANGFQHVISVRPDSANYIVGQLRTHIPGLKAVPADRPDLAFTEAVEIGMTNPGRQLYIPDAKALSQSLLASVQALQPNELVVTQWVVTPTKGKLRTDMHGNLMMEGANGVKGFKRALAYGPSMAPAPKSIMHADSSEAKERYGKLEEPNVAAIGRIAAYSPTAGRAAHLIPPVVTALRSAKSTTTTFKEVAQVFRDPRLHAQTAATPSSFPAQLNVNELSAVIGWPIGHPHVAGLPQGSARHLPATETVPREGCVLGTSNFPGDERPIAVSWLDMMKHLHIMGPTGVGKTTLMDNLIRQAMGTGYGVIVMESKGDLFNAALDAVPESRVEETIVLNVRDTARLVALNVLDQGSSRVVIDQLTDLFQVLYPDTRGVWMRELMYHGLATLAEREGMTFIDLPPLISPRTPEEVAWASEVRKAVRDKELKQFWTRWEALKKDEQERNAAPLHNRIWQLISRPELRNIIGQSKSSFQMDDVLRTNKILLINLSGVPREAASMAGTLIMNAVWTSAQRVRAESPNYLFLDEFQDFIRLPVGAEEMLAKARGFNLSMTLAHQHLAQLSEDVKAAVISNARSKLYFQTSPEDARVVLRSLATNDLNDTDLMHLGTYEAYARVAVGAGSSSPVSLMTKPPAKPEGNRNAVVEYSRMTYGKPIGEIEAEITARRTSSKTASGVKATIGARPAEWGK